MLTVATGPAGLTDTGLRGKLKQSVMRAVRDTDDRIIGTDGQSRREAAVGAVITGIAETLGANTDTVPGTVGT